MTNRFVIALIIPLLALAGCNISYEYHEETKPTSFEVVEYTPAPGQFINEGYSVTTPAEACAYAQQRPDKRYSISLGGFGGYIIIRSLKPILNSKGYDFGIYSNSFEGSSEPGIVWVSCDTNCNGIADDEWFELYGSEGEKSTTLRNYSITYSRTDSATEIAWHSSDGESGIISRNSSHKQDYFPAWITSEEYTLTGTLLPHNSEWDNLHNEWFLRGLEWGYADNHNALDSSANKVNRFRLSDARTPSGEAANLTQVDFVKVQSAIHRINTLIGETSTEINGFVIY